VCSGDIGEQTRRWMSSLSRIPLRTARAALCVTRTDASWAVRKRGSEVATTPVAEEVWIAPVAAVMIVSLCAALAHFTRRKEHGACGAECGTQRHLEMLSETVAIVVAHLPCVAKAAHA
jgi:hypothetical protein